MEMLDKEGRGTWPAKKEMKEGELVLFYRMGGTKNGLTKITDVLKLMTEPYINPFDYYNCFRVEFEKIAEVEIPLAEVQKHWSRVGTVQGIHTENMPTYVFNEIMKEFDVKILEKIEYEIIDTEKFEVDGKKIDGEDEFEKEIVKPFLKTIEFAFDEKPLKKIKIGSDDSKKEVEPDFVLKYKDKPICIVENKYIQSGNGNKILRDAFLQGNSYALLFSVNVFMVCWNDGVRAYETIRDWKLENKENEYVAYFSWKELLNNSKKKEELTNLIKTYKKHPNL
jgi:hypothetical protein